MKRIFLAAVGLAAWLCVSVLAATQDPVRTPATLLPAMEGGNATSELLIFLTPGTDADGFAQDHGLTLGQPLRSDSDAYLFAAPSASEAQALRGQISAHATVRSAYLNETSLHASYAFIPDDPWFNRNTETGYWGQWHLVNAWTAGLDTNVGPAWERGITGQGVTIGIVDDSFETTHPDLEPNYVAAYSWDFGENDPVPDPVHDNDRHGIAVAGIAAARGGNTIGVTGAAPFAGLAGLRLDFEALTVSQLVDATLYQSSGEHTGIAIKNHSYGSRFTYNALTAPVDALADSAAAGTIHAFAAGNNRGSGAVGEAWGVHYTLVQDANKMPEQSSPVALTVTALGSDGTFASYANFGANIVATAPSSTAGGFGITSADRSGEYGYNTSANPDPYIADRDYTSVFGGTSASAPLVAGLLALVKEVQPNLTVRFAKHLLALTSTIVDPDDQTPTSDGGWRTNAAGYHFNQNYGFGLIDADALTLQAPQYIGVTPPASETTGPVAVDQVIPDNDLTGITETFYLTSSLPLEEVLVHLDIAHTGRGDVEAYLTSPSGYTGRLMYRNPLDYGEYGTDIDWTFMSHAFWGENPEGAWELTVLDAFEDFEGTWNSYTVTTNMGMLVIPEPGTVVLITLFGATFVFIRRRRRGA